MKITIRFLASLYSTGPGRLLVLAVICSSFVSVAPHKAAADYGVSGYYETKLYWNVPLGMQSEKEEVLQAWELIQMSLSHEMEGPNGNKGVAKAYAGLGLGRLNTYGCGITPSTSAGIAYGNARSEIEDTLIFTVPAGYYENDVVVTLSGDVGGSLTITGDSAASSRATFAANFGAENVSWAWDDEDGQGFYEDFDLSRTLVSGGSTLPEATVYNVPVGAALYVTGQSRGGHVSTGTADFYSSAHFLSLDVPEGVSWTSESGFFMKRVGKIPAPLVPLLLLED